MPESVQNLVLREMTRLAINRVVTLEWYTPSQPVSVIRAFYGNEMGNAGWILSAIGEGERGHLILIFSKDGEKTTITLYNFASATNDSNSSIQIPPRNVLIVVE